MIKADRKEIFRYLGYRGREPETGVAEAADSCAAALQTVVEPRHVRRVFPLEWVSADRFRIEGMDVVSRDLSRNLRGCSEVCLMAATLGLGPDRLVQREEALGKMSRAVILQAAAAAMIEAYCDDVNEEIRREAAPKGLFLRPRFSPGYGDFSLEHQTELFRILEVQKKIGVTLTGSLLMMPSKSVTAVIGLSKENTHCMVQGCEVCGKQDCSFRRN